MKVVQLLWKNPDLLNQPEIERKCRGGHTSRGQWLTRSRQFGHQVSWKDLINYSQVTFIARFTVLMNDDWNLAEVWKPFQLQNHKVIKMSVSCGARAKWDFRNELQLHSCNRCWITLRLNASNQLWIKKINCIAITPSFLWGCNSLLVEVPAVSINTSKDK